MADVKRLNRLVEMLRMIDKNDKITARDFAEHFGIAERTVYRDLTALEGAQFPIYFDEERGSYRFIEGYTFKKIDMTLDEIRAVLATQAVVSKLGGKISTGFGNVLKKIKSTAGPRAGKGLGCEPQHYWFDIDPAVDSSAVQAPFDAVQKALDSRTTLEIVYKGMGDQKETVRRIDPYGIFYSSGVWYTLAWCHMRESIRQFALDCFKSVKDTGRPYTIPADFSMEKYFKAGWHIVRYGKPVNVKLLFSKDVARWITRRKWHPTQKIETKKDGSLVFTVTLDGTEEIRRWVYHWGPNCEVLAPAAFRKEVMGELKTMVKVYTKKK